MTNADNPLVSCIIIFLDGEKFLAESINSILTQTYSNWELLLVDDGSTDGSSEIALDYVRRHPEKVFYLEHENHSNLGKNVSRNLGVRQARGSYIATLDADDIWLPDKLAEQIEIMERTPEAGMVYGRTQIWFSWANGQESALTDTFYELGVEPDKLVNPPRLFLLLLEGWAQTPTTCNALIRRSVFDELDGFDESYHDIFEDQIFFAKLELNYPVYVASNVWARYRQHPESSFSRYSEHITRDRSKVYTVVLKFLNWIETYLDGREFSDHRVRAFVQTRIKSVERKLRLIQIPFVGFLLVSWLRFLEWVLGITSKIGRSVLPKSVRDWLWRHVGKKVYIDL